LLFANPVNGARIGIPQDEILSYLKKNSRHQTNLIFSELSQEDY
jgi:hypothetical protein